MSQDRLTVDARRDPNRVLFAKICKNKQCRAAFTSSSRNAEYCNSPTCQASRMKVSVQSSKEKKVYQREREKLLAETRARKESRAKAISNIVLTECWACGEDFLIRDLECHHIDGNCHNRADWNLSMLCVPCHSKVSSGDEEVATRVAFTRNRMEEVLVEKGWSRDSSVGSYTNIPVELSKARRKVCEQCLTVKLDDEVGVCQICGVKVCRLCLKEGAHKHEVTLEV